MSNKLNLTQDEIIKAMEFGRNCESAEFVLGLMAGVRAGVNPDEQLAPAWVKHALGKKYDKRVNESVKPTSYHTTITCTPTWETINGPSKA